MATTATPIPLPGAAAVAFRRVREPVEVRLAGLEEPGSQAFFKIWIDEPAAPGGELLLRGVAVRLEDGTVDAWSLLCPHEICEIELVTDAGSLPREVGPLPARPLLACPCHFSVFDPEAGGARLAGPASRGLYRFGFTIIGEGVRIDRVEAALVDRFVVPEPNRGVSP